MNNRKDHYLLIVDDQPAICELLEEVFISEGYCVETALNSDQAVRAIRARTPELIFMDINMPGKNGLETLKDVQGLISNVPVIMITAYGELEDVMEVRKLGLIQHYITKPFDIISLIKLVRRIMTPVHGVKSKAANQ
ncbi:MAG: response regulator [Thermacetogeniaceae bacterium]|jgi:two-component system response regulator (stage 0 sporulation protein F)